MLAPKRFAATMTILSILAFAAAPGGVLAETAGTHLPEQQLADTDAYFWFPNPLRGTISDIIDLGRVTPRPGGLAVIGVGLLSLAFMRRLMA